VKQQRGFTLIELMIVVAIIAILAAIAISQYQDYVAKAQLTEAFSIADGLRTTVVENYTQTAICPDNTDPTLAYGIPGPASIAGKYIAQTVTGGVGTTDGGCTLTMTFKPSGSVSNALAAQQITFTLVGVVNGPAHWECSTAIPAKYLPATCF
jgi:type IV pilus assembly protein PilA